MIIFEDGKKEGVDLSLHKDDNEIENPNPKPEQILGFYKNPNSEQSKPEPILNFYESINNQKISDDEKARKNIHTRKLRSDRGIKRKKVIDEFNGIENIQRKNDIHINVQSDNWLLKTFKVLKYFFIVTFIGLAILGAISAYYVLSATLGGKTENSVAAIADNLKKETSSISNTSTIPPDFLSTPENAQTVFNIGKIPDFFTVSLSKDSSKIIYPMIVEDINCPACAYVSTEMMARGYQHTVIPVAKINKESWERASIILCGRDKHNQALEWGKAMLGNPLPNIATNDEKIFKECSQKIIDNTYAINKLKINGTPAFIFKDGKVIIGLKKIEQLDEFFKPR